MGAIFFNLLNTSITASWLILVVIGIRFFFQKMPKWGICVLWGIVAVRLTIPFSIESKFSLLPSAQPIKPSAIVEGDILPYVPSIDSDLTIVENTINPMLADAFAYHESSSLTPMQSITEIAGEIWLCGMIVLLVFAIRSIVRLLFLVREAVCYKGNVFICDEVKSPFILGLFKPRIYLSSTLKDEELDFCLAHEKAHLRRKDHLWKPLGYLILCIYWFHPLCWMSYIMLCKDIELACDEKVIKNMSFADKKEYSRILLSCATQKRLIFACPLAFGEVGIKERVKNILNYKKPAFGVTMTAIWVCMIVAVCFLTNPLEKTESETSIYKNIVAALEDEDTYAFLVMNSNYPVLLTSDLIYNEGTEQQAAVYCDVYYPVNGKANMLGTIMSDGTAYPITFTKDGIFAASAHKIEKYTIAENGTLYLEKGIYEQFDKTGNPIYTSITGLQENASTLQEYQELLTEYSKSQIVHFSYGAEDSVNEYLVTDQPKESTILQVSLHCILTLQEEAGILRMLYPMASQ